MTMINVIGVLYSIVSDVEYYYYCERCFIIGTNKFVASVVSIDTGNNDNVNFCNYSHAERHRAGGCRGLWLNQVSQNIPCILYF